MQNTVDATRDDEGYIDNGSHGGSSADGWGIWSTCSGFFPALFSLSAKVPGLGVRHVRLASLAQFHKGQQGDCLSPLLLSLPQHN